MRRRRIALGLAVVAVLVILSGALVPGLLARAAARRMTAALRTPVRVGWLSWNPIRGTWLLRGMRIAADRGPAAVSARRLRARVDLWNVLRGDYRVRTLVLEGARMRWRATSGGWELPLPPSDATAAETVLPAVTCDWLGAPGAHVRLESQQGGRSRLRLRELEASGSLAPERTQAAIWTRGRLDRGSIAFAGQLRSTTEARRVRLRFAATGLDLARTLRLAPGSSVRDLRGRIDVRAKYDEAGPPSHVARRVGGSLGMHDLALGAPGVEAVWVRYLTVGRFDLDLDRRSLGLETVRARGTEAWLRRENGHLRLPALPRGNASGDGWTVTVSRADAVDGLVHVVGTTDAESLDVVLSEAHLGRLAAPEAATPFSFEAALASGGTVSGEGALVRAPFGGTARARVDGFLLPPLLDAARSSLRLESGRASGTVEASIRDGGVELAGDVTLADVKSVAPEGFPPEDVLAFKDARLRLRRARMDPPDAAFDAIDVSWPYVLIDRTVERIFPFSLASAPGPPSASGRSALPEISIDRIHVLGGRIDFRDTTLAPPYWRSLANFTLDARAVEVPAMRAGTVQGTGLVDEVSPLRVRGTVGERTRFVAEVERLALPPFNAYLVEGAWPYSVSSGLLTGRSELTLERSQLEVDNHVVLSRLGLASAQRDDLIQRELGIPLTLALALMKDYRGDIALSLPFGGDLNEPTLEFRSVVVQAMLRAIRGAVLSPLNALGRVFLHDGRIERVDLEPIPFPPGRRELDTAGRERLAQVAHVLQSHRELAVSLHGAAATVDVEHLQTEAALATLVDDPSAEPLRAVLRARLAESPPPSIGEREATRLDTLLAGLPWPGPSLRDLALDRGAVAASTLIVDHRVDPGRVSADPPSTPGPETLAPAPSVYVELNPG